MPRQVRIEFAGAFYHVMARGDRREAIFDEDSDREDFLETLARACAKTGWRVHAWVLMSNHYHWLIETPEPNLVAGMQWFQNTYTRRFNLRRGRWGHLFGGRYKSVVVDPDDSDGYYFERLTDYIHLNPVRAGLVNLREGRGLLDYPWSSLSSAYAVAPSRRPPWLVAGEGLAVSGCKDTAMGRRRYVEKLAKRHEQEETREEEVLPEGQTLQSTLRRGWYWGSEALKEKLLARRSKPTKGSGGHAYRLSPEGQDHSRQEADRIVKRGLKKHKLTEERMRELPGSHPLKLEIAAEVWEKTAVKQGWIASRLAMGSAGNVSQQLFRRQQILRAGNV